MHIVPTPDCIRTAAFYSRLSTVDCWLRAAGKPCPKIGGQVGNDSRWGTLGQLVEGRVGGQVAGFGNVRKTPVTRILRLRDDSYRKPIE